MDNLIVLNGEQLKFNATLQDLKDTIKKYNCKIKNCYTFEMKNGFRRVIQLVAQGDFYSVYSWRHFYDNAYCSSGKCIYYGFNKEKAEKICDEFNGELSIYNANEINFVLNLKYKIDID